jgi:hypothetical protein
MTAFQKNYNQVLSDIGGIYGTSQATEYVSNIDVAIDSATNALRQEAAHRVNVSEDYLKGWLAEQWHAETLKVSGQARGRDDIWANVQGNNRPGEDVLYGDSGISNVAEVKYYKSGADTAKAVSRPEYEGHPKIIPGDQKESVRIAAERQAQRNQDTRPEQAAQYDDTARNADDRLHVGNANSKPLDEVDAKHMAEDFKRDGDITPDKYGLNSENFVEWTDIARQSGEAALHAAALSAALAAGPHIWKILNEYIESGEIDVGSFAERGNDVLFTAGTAGLRGGIAASLTAACKSGLLGESLKGVSPSAIGMATTMTLNCIKYSVQLQQGKITQREFAHHCLRDTFVLSTGMSGAVIGQLIIPIPMLGALVGNLVGATLGAVVFEGVDQFIMGICVESGWTFFGLVEQNYVVSEDILELCGYDLFSKSSFQTQSFSTSSFSVQSFSVNSLSFQPVRRGVISCHAIGYM